LHAYWEPSSEPFVGASVAAMFVGASATATFDGARLAATINEASVAEPFVDGMVGRLSGDD
jgi:hypothetical protein